MHKVVHLVHWRMSGIFEVARMLHNEARKRGHNHDLVTIRKDKSDKNGLFHHIKIFRNLVCRCNSPDIVIHAHSFLPFLMSFFVWKSRLVWTFHNTYPFLIDRSLKARLKRRILIVIAHVRKPIVTVVGAEVGNYVLMGIGIRGVVIENGLETEQYSFREITKSPEVFGSVGRYDSQKNYTSLIKAWDHLAMHRTLLIAGEGEERAVLEGLIKSNPKDVKLVGFVDDIDQFYREIDAFICSSVFEGFGLVLVEAMLNCKPIISTHVGVIEDHPEFKVVRAASDAPGLTLAVNEFLYLELNELNQMIRFNFNLAKSLYSLSDKYDEYSKTAWQSNNA